MFFILSYLSRIIAIDALRGVGAAVPLRPYDRPVLPGRRTNMANEKILVVDDDQNICELLRL